MRSRRPGRVVPEFSLYGEPVRTVEERLVHVERIAVRSEVRAWQIRAHRHTGLHQLLLVSEGQVQVGLDGSDFVLPAPCVVVVPAGTVHGYRFRPGTEGVVVTVSQDLAQDELRRVPGLLSALERTFTLTGTGAAGLPELARLLLEEFDGGESGRSQVMTSLLASLLIRVLRRAGEGGHSAGAEVPQGRALFLRFRELIERHLRSPLPVRRYAALLGVSETRLRRCCAESAGKAPGELVRLRQLREAQRQLHYTTRPIGRIAWDLGFRDPAYFSRFFARRVGLSPRRYRQRADQQVEAQF